MARPVTLDYYAIKEEVESKGVVVTDVRRDSGKLTIYFDCTACGAPYEIRHQNYVKGDNPKFLCRECQLKEGPKMQRIKSYFEAMNVPIESVDFNDETGHSLKHWVIHFNCSRCGNPYTIIDDYVGKNNKELCCPYCRDNNTRPTQSAVEEEFRKRNSELLSEYKNNKSPLKFRCTCCGGVGEISYIHFKRKDVNPELLCLTCLGIPDTKAELIDLLKSVGSELVGEYKSVDLPADVLCSHCHKPFKFNFGNYKYCGQNTEVICKNCRIEMSHSSPTYVGDSRKDNPIDQYWMNYAVELFNIFGEDKKIYSAHHISHYATDLDRRTSFVNVFPLRSDLHVGNSHYYHYEDGMDINKWTGVEKLPYHTYPGFKFLDLNEKCITEILWPSESMDMHFLYKRKKSFNDQGILYLPFFYNEIRTKEQRQLAFSMIRARLYKWFPDIYNYTGTVLKKYYARKLEVKRVSHPDAMHFFNANHIQGAVNSQIYLGLYTLAGELVSCMAFSKPRSGTDCDFEITRFASVLNSQVIGGASKLFKNFVETFNPGSIVSFCDLRFSSMDPNDTVYARLGFSYDGYSDPNYGYRTPGTNEVKSRRSYQKSMLVKLFEDYDPVLTEFQNMENHGYIRHVDCGNYKFIWRA